MQERVVRRFLFLASACVVLLLWFPQHASAQRVEDSCDAFFDSPHQALDCVEAVFTQTDIPYYLPHLTMSSLPPGNGFPIGLAYEKRTNYVSSPFPSPDQSSNPSPGYKSLVDAKAAFVISTNDSWYVTGSVAWLPPLHYTDQVKRNGDACHRLWFICTKQVFGINFSITHRTLQNISFYGLGSSSPNIQLSYRQRETYGGALARMPIFDWLTLDGQIENRKPSVEFSSASFATTAITEISAPGFSTQPDFMHYAVNVGTHEQAISEPVTDDPAVTPPGAPQPPLQKHRLVFIFDNAVSQHWYSDQDTGHYSFRQVVIDGNESVKLHSIIRRFVPPRSMTTKLRIIKHFCDDRAAGLKVHDECNFGQLSIRPYLVFSRASPGVVPFYLQPTLGGSDIDSRLTLRGFADYRFRAPDAAMVSVDYEIPVSSPLGLLLFYDAGTVGTSAGALSFTHARQDGGLGVTLRVLNNVIAEMYVGFGASDGPRFGYNFTKFF